MEIGSILGSASRALEAFEKIQQAGEQPASAGSAPIADSSTRELGKLFENLLDAQQNQESGTAANGSAEGAAAGGAAGAGDPAGGQPMSADLPADAPQKDAETAGTVSEPAVSPGELYSMQFHAAMLRFTAESGSQTQRQAAQGLDSLLRSQS